jgi:2-polyprenyl-3-methyl-5-hydroxy-6-metoxy-1,4-benzoquinol methylase
MSDLYENHKIWNQLYDWSLLGEEWSYDWGGSEAQWFGSIFPRIHRLLPCNNILEIAPGFGRWTKYLTKNSQKYTGVDISTKCIDFCKDKYSINSNINFYTNDGLSLQSIQDNDFDFIFSFDSLVHCELDVHESYIPQILSKLSYNGFAFIHHSNLADDRIDIRNVDKKHARSTTVSAKKFAELVLSHGGSIVSQELLNWGSTGTELIDTITIFCKYNTNIIPIYIENKNFMMEAQLIKSNQSLYSKINNVSVNN